MKAEELRLGNYIYWNIPEKLNVIHTVVGIVNYRPQTVPISLGDSMDDYRPILLNESWLKDFGFERFGTTAKYWSLNGVDVWELDGGYANDLDRPVKYVHELQNLYHAHMGVGLKLSNL